MIIQLTGKVNYPLTLDPGVWIFDDRKVEWDNAFEHNTDKLFSEQNSDDDLKKTQERWSREVYQQKLDPPINKSISRFERNKILEGTYVMPLKPFLENAEIHEDAAAAVLTSSEGDQEITISQLHDGYFLFAREGKPLKEDGPVYFYFGDGSNKDTPIKGVNKITIK